DLLGQERNVTISACLSALLFRGLGHPVVSLDFPQIPGGPLKDDVVSDIPEVEIITVCLVLAIPLVLRWGFLRQRLECGRTNLLFHAVIVRILQVVNRPTSLE